MTTRDHPATSAILSRDDLATMVTDLVAAGTQVIAPVRTRTDPRRTEYQPIQKLEDAALGGPLTRRSLKELFLPPTEVLLRYRVKKNDVELEEVPTAFAPRVVLGARPCDAAGVETLDKVMGWDYRDELWFGRREATTIVTLACPAVDSSCFCSAVGLGPDSAKGSDALLVPLAAAPGLASTRETRALEEAVDGFLRDAAPFEAAAEVEGDAERAGRQPRAAARFLAQAVTEKGEALLEGRGEPFSDPRDFDAAARFTKAARERLAKNLVAMRLGQENERIDRELEAELGIAAADGGQLVVPLRSIVRKDRPAAVSHLADWLARNFDHPLWKSLALRCHGCGACAAVCSTCHCFDIVDEHDGYGNGARRRNWDFCQAAKFTMHASGHNPRPKQTERFRQRVMHKFSIYPRRFDAILCTGCGRCARACSAGMNLPRILGELVQLAAAEGGGSRP